MYEEELKQTTKDLRRKRYLKKKSRHRPTRTLVQDENEISLLKSDPRVEWVQQQLPKKRVKRDFIDFVQFKNNPRPVEKPSNKNSKNYNNNDNDIKFNDPMWPKLWYIVSISIFIYLFINKSGLICTQEHMLFYFTN